MKREKKIAAVEQLVDWMGEHRLTQSEAATVVGVSQGTISSWVHGRNLPTSRTVEMIDEATATSPWPHRASTDGDADQVVKQLVDWMDEHGQSQSSVARALGYTRAAVSLWATGKTAPSTRACRSILDLIDGGAA